MEETTHAYFYNICKNKKYCSFRIYRLLVSLMFLTSKTDEIGFRGKVLLFSFLSSGTLFLAIKNFYGVD